ncbi:MAG: hypothetical protein CM1200mP11_0940 [Nitrosopumilaceae archaeon]|nr:MAG: hypothetical protein CM1200mP11_0940 [Nitrosopumilaceae archaeon]
MVGRWNIDDQSFIQGIQFLVKEKILKIPETTQGTGSGKDVPSWVKNNAGWWADGTLMMMLSFKEFNFNQRRNFES